MPFSRATSKMVSRSPAPTSRPSIASVCTCSLATAGLSTGRMGIGTAIGGPSLSRGGRRLGHVLVAEIPKRAEHRVRRGLAEPAQAGARHHVAQLLELLQVGSGRRALAELRQQVVHV